MDAPVETRRGYLHKRGGIRTNWQCRLFVLNSGFLSYFDVDTPKGTIELANFDLVKSPREPEDVANRPFTFQLRPTAASVKRRNSSTLLLTGRDRSFFLQAFSHEDKTEWMREISQFTAAGASSNS